MKQLHVTLQRVLQQKGKNNFLNAWLKWVASMLIRDKTTAGKANKLKDLIELRVGSLLSVRLTSEFEGKRSCFVLFFAMEYFDILLYGDIKLHPHRGDTENKMGV